MKTLVVSVEGVPTGLVLSTIGFFQPVMDKDNKPTDKTIIRFHSMPVGLIAEISFSELFEVMNDI